MSKKIGLALSAGSARGLSHIGVLKVLEKNNIELHCITGTSMGALIGALYAAGYNAKAIEDVALKIKWNGLLDFTFPKLGLIAGSRVEDMIRKLLNNVKFEDLKIPLKIIGTDINTREEIIFEKGDVAEAVRASISLPFFFKPVFIRNHMVVDGGLVNPVPIDHLKEMGANFIIATDITTNHTRKRHVKGRVQKSLMGFMKEKLVVDETKIIKDMIDDPTTTLINRPVDKIISYLLTPKRILKLFKGKKTPPILEVAMMSSAVAVNQIAKNTLKSKDIDVIVKPKLNMMWSDFDKVEYAIKQGEKAAKESLPKIKRKL